MRRRIWYVAADLSGHQLAQVGAAPVRRGHQILGGRQRLEPPVETGQEGLDRAGVAPGLRGDALDDGQQVLGAMADLAQQRTQRLFALLAVGDVDPGGYQPVDGAIRRMVGIDGDLVPVRDAAVGNADLEGSRLARVEDRSLGGGKAIRLAFREEIVVVQARDVATAPTRRHVLCPHGPQAAVLIEQRDAGMAEGAHQAASHLGRLRIRDVGCHTTTRCGRSSLRTHVATIPSSLECLGFLRIAKTLSLRFSAIPNANDALWLGIAAEQNAYPDRSVPVLSFIRLP